MTEIVERTAVLHAARTSHCEQACDGEFTLWAAASEADLAPLHGASECALGSVVCGFHAFLVEEGEEPFEMQAQRRSEILYVLIAAVEMAKGQSKELLLQRNGFKDQLFPCDRSIPDTRTGTKPVPETEQPRVQGEKGRGRIVLPRSFWKSPARPEYCA